MKKKYPQLFTEQDLIPGRNSPKRGEYDHCNSKQKSGKPVHHDTRRGRALACAWCEGEAKRPRQLALATRDG
jgi:hypothetical protein